MPLFNHLFLPFYLFDEALLTIFTPRLLLSLYIVSSSYLAIFPHTLKLVFTFF